MYGFGHQPLASTGLAIDQNGTVTVGHPLDQFEHACHCTAFADNPLKTCFMDFHLIERRIGVIFAQGSILDLAYCHLFPLF